MWAALLERVATIDADFLFANMDVDEEPSRAPPTPDLIELASIVLSSIEKYLDLQSTITLAATCKCLRSHLVHEGKIKASHFETGSQHDMLIRVHTGEHNWLTAPGRIFNYMPKALNTIYFPSLKRLALSFPDSVAIYNEHPISIPNGYMSSWPMLSFLIADAHKLEELLVDSSALIKPERDTCGMEGTYKMFGQNLSKCTKLRSLVLHNVFSPAENPSASVHSAALLRHLTPVVEKRVDRLEDITLFIGGESIEDQRWDGAHRDFFVSVLTLEKLRHLNVHITATKDNTVLCEFLEACTIVSRSNGMRLRSSSLGFVQLVYEEIPQPDDDDLAEDELTNIEPFLRLLGESSELNVFSMTVPRTCWSQESVDALKRVITRKPSLNTVRIDFRGYRDDSEKIASCLSEFLSEKEATDELRRCCFSRIMKLPFEESDSALHLRKYVDEHGRGCFRIAEDGEMWNFLFSRVSLLRSAEETE